MDAMSIAEWRERCAYVDFRFGIKRDEVSDGHQTQ